MSRAGRAADVAWRVLAGCAVVLLAGALVAAVAGHRAGQWTWPWEDDRAAGPLALAAAADGPDVAPGRVRVTGVPGTRDAPADALGVPTSGLDGVDLSGISPGGGQGPEGYDWTTLRPGELMIPRVNLVLPVVERGIVRDGSRTRSMELPVSFAAARLRESASITAHHGTTVVAGHVNWSDGSWAPMSNLYNTAPGMPVYLADRSGRLTTWRITATADIPQSQLSHRVSLTDTRGPRRLVLITCKAERGADGSVVFTRNWVVTAEPV